jgi:hypothetical protein
MVLILLAGAIVWSVWKRVCRLRALDSSTVKKTPFSSAVQDLVATAGGVYLSIIALVSFLKLNIPEKLVIDSVSFDPMALLAICVAVTQPWWGKLFPNSIE